MTTHPLTTGSPATFGKQGLPTRWTERTKGTMTEVDDCLAIMLPGSRGMGSDNIEGRTIQDAYRLSSARTPNGRVA